MDILIHTCSGAAIGSVAASFTNKGFLNKLKIIGLSAFAGALPDIDAISLWSGFDQSIGKLFKLSNQGVDIYFDKRWYSHHAFMHSIFAGLIATISLGCLKFIISSAFKKEKNGFISLMIKNRTILISFFLSYFIHLLEDMPTPASYWGGVNLLWPSSAYAGGTGQIWWWNNYDIFLIVLSVFILNIIFHILNRVFMFNIRKLTLLIFGIGFSLAIYQINSRGYEFAYFGHTTRFQEFEENSKKAQKRILGDKLYKLMVKFDNKLNINF